MGRAPDERITNDVAREICVREGAKAMLTGSIGSLGTHYVITVSALNAQNGDVLQRSPPFSFTCQIGLPVALRPIPSTFRYEKI